MAIGAIVGGAASAAGGIASALAGPPEIREAGGEELALRRKERKQLTKAGKDIRYGARLGGMVLPEMFRDLGLNPIVEDLSGAQQAYADAQGAIETSKARRKELRGIKGRDAKKKRRQLTKQIKKAKKTLPGLEKEATRVPSITGFGPAGELDPSTSAGRSAALVEGLSDRILAGLKGETTDPALMRELEEDEESLREALRRRLGPDYAMSTPGSKALADFTRGREIAISDVSRRDITDFLPLMQEERITQGNLAAQRQALLGGAADRPFGTAGARRALAEDWYRTHENLQRERLAEFGVTGGQRGPGWANVLSQAGSGLMGVSTLGGGEGGGNLMSAFGEAGGELKGFGSALMSPFRGTNYEDIVRRGHGGTRAIT